MPFCGNVSHKAMVKLITKALRRGSAEDGNRSVSVVGDVEIYDTFVGPFYKTNGRIECRYYGKLVFVVDFANKRVSDNGYNGYNSCTRKTISGYEDALFELLPLNLPKKKIKHNYSRWTGGPPNGMAARFLARMPWFEYTGIPWFRWEVFEGGPVEAYGLGQLFLAADQNWRWFTYDWDEHGNWSRKFIDADAERRYRQREKRWQRISTTIKTSCNRPSTRAALLTSSTLLSGSSTQSGILPGTEVTLSLPG